MKRFVYIAAMALTLLAVPANASAAPFDEQAERAYQMAIEYWGAEPTSCSSLDREIVAPEFNPADPEAVGWATIPSNDTQVPCELKVVRVYGFPGPECDTMVHEVGHLLGYQHTSDPASVMTPNRPALLPACAALQRRFEVGTRLREQRRRCARVQMPRCWHTARKLVGTIASLH